MMKNCFNRLRIPLCCGILACACLGCDDDTAAPVPVAPLLKEIKFPGIDELMPGQTARIAGIGFSKTDKLYLVQDGTAAETTVTEVTDNELRFVVPAEAAGEYSVVIERDGKQTTLPGKLNVPFVVPVTEIQLPETAVEPQAEVFVGGKGFHEGDRLRLSAPFYPDGGGYTLQPAVEENGIRFTVPEGAYGINTLTVTRENRLTNLGNITVITRPGDKAGGGIVFYVDAAREHGFIVSPETTGTATEQFGPEVAPADAAGTSEALGNGAENTRHIVAKMAQLRAANDWPEWRNAKIAAELCAEYTRTENGLTYSDWFLPSREELVEVFKVKALLQAAGASISANNYWTSSEPEGNAGWAAYYVNFYEDTDIVSEFVSKSGWKIGVLPVRAY